MTSPAVRVRPAETRDEPTIARLLAVEIAQGTVLPRDVRADEFLVAELNGVICGVVGCSDWGDGVLELGSLVSAVRGRGVGAALVARMHALASDRGARALVALTGVPAFFERVGFARVHDAPWARARGCDSLPTADTADLASAIGTKARGCAQCARLSRCDQTLLVARPTAHEAAHEAA